MAPRGVVVCIRLGALAVVAGLLALSLARELPQGDPGEITTAAARLGVLHPTGFPLYTLVGHAAVRALPVAPFRALEWLNVAFALGIVGAVAAAVRALLSAPAGDGRPGPGPGPGPRSGPAAGGGRPAPHGLAVELAGLAAGAALVTSPELWGQVRIPEVYTLHALVVAAGLAACARHHARSDARALVLAGVALAVGAAHHATVVQLGVAFALWLVLRRPGLIAAWRRGGDPRLRRVPVLWALALAAALASYAYLPWAARHTTAVPWGDPTTPGRFAAHVTGGLYRGFVAWNPLVAGQRIAELAPWIATQLTPVGLALATVGLVALLRRAPAFAAAFGAYAVGVLTGALAYQVGDWRSYLLPAAVVLWLLAGVGLGALAGRLPPRAALATAAVAIAGVLALAGTRLEAVQREPIGTEPYVAAVADGLPPGSLYLTARDPYLLPLWHAQHVEGRGTELAAVSLFLLDAPWYRDAYLRPRHPLVCDPARGRPAGRVACGDFAARIARFREAPVSWLGLDDAPLRGELLPASEAAPPRDRRGMDPRCRDLAFREAHGPLCRCFEERPRRWDHACAFVAERDAVIPLSGVEVAAHRLVEDHVGERRVFERNVFTYWFEGKVGRLWDGPAFHRISADWALVSRGAVNEIVPAGDVAGLDPCASERLGVLPVRPRRAPSDRADPTPPAARRPYRANPEPLLLRASAVRAGRQGGVELVLDWHERWSWSDVSPDRRGRRLRHGVRACFFGPGGARLHTASIVSGTRPGVVALPAARLAGAGGYVVQACDTGDLGGGPLAPDAPCTRALLEVPFALDADGGVSAPAAPEGALGRWAPGKRVD